MPTMEFPDGSTMEYPKGIPKDLLGRLAERHWQTRQALNAKPDRAPDLFAQSDGERSTMAQLDAERRRADVPQGAPPIPSPVRPPKNPLLSIGNAVNYGVGMPVAGAAQLNNMAMEGLGMVPEGTTDDFTYQTNQRIQEFNQGAGLPEQIAAFGGEALASMLVPGGIGGSAARRMATGAGTGALLGGTAFQPENDPWGRALSTAVGAGAGMLVPAPSSAVTGVGREALKGRPDIIARSEQATQFGMPLKTGELLDSPTMRNLEAFTEQTPLIGTGRTSQRQIDAVRPAVDRMKRMMGVGDEEPIDAVLEFVSDLPEARKKLQAEAGKHLNDAIDVVRGIPAPAPRLEQGWASMVEGMRTSNARPEEWPAAYKALERLLPEPGTPARRDMKGLWTIRQTLDAMIDKGTQGKGNISSSDVPYFQRLREAVTKDIEEHADAHGVLKQWRLGNAEYQKNLDDFRLPKMRQLISKSETDIDRVLPYLQSSPDLMQRAYKHATPNGRAKFKTAIIGKAVEFMKDETKMNGEIMPHQVAKAMEKVLPGVKATLTQRDGKIIEGLARLMNTVKGASRITSPIMTGGGAQQLKMALAPAALGVGGIAAGQGMGGDGSQVAMGIGGALLGLSPAVMVRALNSKAAQERIIRLARQQPGSPGQIRNLKALDKLAQRASVQAAIDTTTDEPE